MEGARAALALSLIEGYSAMANDVRSAYTQAFLKGIKTYVHLPKERWPAHWHGKYTNPVVPLVLALYGHPDSGTYWVERCIKAVAECGFRHLKSDGWNSVFWNCTEKAMLVVYVDDFNLAAPCAAQCRIWKGLRARIDMDEPSEPDRFLGCYMRRFETTAAAMEPMIRQTPRLYPRQEPGQKKEEVVARPVSTLPGYDPK